MAVITEVTAGEPIDAGQVVTIDQATLIARRALPASQPLARVVEDIPKGTMMEWDLATGIVRRAKARA